MPVVDARKSGNVITLSANGITIEGFTATGGSPYSEAGIKVNSNSKTLKVIMPFSTITAWFSILPVIICSSGTMYLTTTTNASAGTPPDVYELPLNATDKAGNGIINIGDCLRLANRVAFPNNPIYILK